MTGSIIAYLRFYKLDRFLFFVRSHSPFFRTNIIIPLIPELDTRIHMVFIAINTAVILKFLEKKWKSSILFLDKKIFDLRHLVL